ncbi:hypothetical protein [Cryobacterium sp. Hh7]|uniref:hypothetical protein n=1 Tax=Cryobacterium sp. Hh7 TaxID=1259159 RepID=UPI00141BC031|nr:hypothetical protein [Cryobacterium sp. Hh7]
MMPTRRSNHQYRPYVARVGTTAEMTIASQNVSMVGGTSVPVAAAITTSAREVTATCTVNVTSTGVFTRERMMLLHDSALVTVGMETFPHPVDVARDVARSLLAAPAR